MCCQEDAKSGHTGSCKVFNEEIAVRKKENKFLANVQLLRVIEEKTKNNSHPFSFTMYASVGKLMSFRKQF